MRLSRRHILTSAATLVVLTVGVAFTAPWVTERAIAHVAQTRGLSVRCAGGRIGLRGIWFNRIELDDEQRAALHAQINAVCVSWSSLFGTRRLSVGSGRVALSGTPDELRKLLSDPIRVRTTSTLGSRALTYDLHHIDVEWQKATEGQSRVNVVNLEISKSDDKLSVRAETLTAQHGAVALELRGAIVEPGGAQDAGDSTDAKPTPWRVKAAEVLAKYASPPQENPDVDARGSGRKDGDAAKAKSEPNASASAVQTPKLVASAAPSANSLRNPAALAKPNQAKGSVKSTASHEFMPALAWVLDEVEHLKTELTDELGDTGPQAAHWMERVTIGTSFESPALRIRVADEGQKLELGPWTLKAERGEQEFNVEVSQNATAGKTALTATLVLTDRFERGKVRFAVGPITLQQLGVSEGDFGLENIAATQLEIDARAEFESRTGELSVESKGWVERLSIRQPYLARETVRDIGFSWEGAVAVDAVKRQIRSDKLHLSIGPVSARLHGTVELGHDYQTLVGGLDVPLAACQDLFAVLPEGLAPLLRGWRVDRSFAMQLKVAFDSRKPNKATVGLKLDNDCRVKSVPQEAAPSRFEQPFALDVEDEQGSVQSMSFGPGTLGWTPLVAISPYVESAVLVCEDGGFLYHNGFDRVAIQNSIRENLRTMRFARGASTVTMQLAKNLYLRRDKTIARKLQEAALTMLLEQSFDKRQLLELYLNVIEFGPGIYGIGPAAKHYFDTTPERLTLAQSFFLISLLPNPKAHHFGPDGLVRPGWMKLVHSLLTIAQKRGHFSEAELEAGLAEQLAFRVAGTPAAVPTQRVLHDPGTALEDEPTLPPVDDG